MCVVHTGQRKLLLLRQRGDAW